MGITIEKNFNYFLEHDFAKYKDGEWVAIYNNKVICHAENLRAVIDMAKEKAPMAQVLFSKVKKTASFL